MPEGTKPKKKTSGAADSWKPTPESRQRATRLRWIAAALWTVAIAVELVAIFWLLGAGIREDDIERNSDGTLTETTGAFPDWALWTLIGLIVLTGILSITGSVLWKRANRLDPPAQSEGVMYWVKTQLGAILAIVAFLPMIILIFLNKDMDPRQKSIAGVVGILVALGAVLTGADFSPPSVEKYTADKTAVISLLGEDRTYWAAGGEVYHVCADVSDLSDSEVLTGTTAEAVEAGKDRLTLQLSSELRACDRPVPTNIEEIVSGIRDIRDGVEGATLPQPIWPDGVQAPTIPGDEDGELTD